MRGGRGFSRLLPTEPSLGWIRASGETTAREQRPEPGYIARRGTGLGLRTELAGTEQGTLGARIRVARNVPYIGFIGAEEAFSGALALRLRDGRRLDAAPASQVLAGIGERVARRDPELWPGGLA